MPDQEFLASFGVQIDESGLNRLQQALQDNRTLAEDVASAFDAARAAVESFFAGLPDLSGGGASVEGEGSGFSFPLSLDFTAATKQLTAYFKEMSNSLHLSADATGVVSAGRSALNQLQSLYAGTALRLSVSLSPTGGPPGTPSASSGGAGSRASALLSGTGLAGSAAAGGSRSVQAPVSINVTASAGSAEAVGRSVYNVAEQYLLRTLNHAMG